MSTTYYVSAIIASLVTCAIGAFGMRFIFERSREISEREDPRDTQIRDLQASLTVAQKDAKVSKTLAGDAKDHVSLAHERIHEVLAERHKAAEQLDTCKEHLKTKIAEREALFEKAAAAEREVSQLKEKLQEIELELSMSNDSGNMLDPSMQAGERTQTAIRALNVEKIQFQEQLSAAQNRVAEAEKEAGELKVRLQQAEEKLGGAEAVVSAAEKQEYDQRLAVSERRAVQADKMLTVAKAQLQDAEQKLKLAQGKLAEDQARLTTIQTELNSAREKLATDQARVAAAEKRTAEKLTAAQAEMATAETRASEAESKLAAAEARAAAADEKVSTAEARAAKAESKAMVMDSERAKATVKLANIEEKLAHAETKISTLQSRLSVATKVSDESAATAIRQTTEIQAQLLQVRKDAEEKTGSTNNKVAEVERTQFQAKITALQSKVATAEKRLSAAEAKLADAQRAAEEKESKVAEAEKRLSVAEAKRADAQRAAEEKESKLSAAENEVEAKAAAARKEAEAALADARRDAESRLAEAEANATARLAEAELELAGLKERLEAAERKLEAPASPPTTGNGASRAEPAPRPALDPVGAMSDTVLAKKMYESTVSDGSPSLIQCLTEELDRWKRHARVLGDELKHQRDHDEDAAETESDGMSADAASGNLEGPGPELGPRLDPEQEPEPPAHSAADSDGARATVDAVPHPASGPARETESASGAGELRDALTDIRGIGQVIADKLNEAGIHTFMQLASVEGTAMDRVLEVVPDFAHRMKRFDFKSQAQALHDRKYGGPSQAGTSETIFSSLPTT